MKITFISPYSVIANYGVRSLSAVLKSAGHQTNIICLNDSMFEGASGKMKIKNNKALIEQITDIVSDSDIIGITLMSCHLPAVVELTPALKTLNKPIIWGGVHPTLLPDGCFEYADIVCMGEGEEAVLELVQKIEADEEPYQIKNLWFKGKKPNPLRVLTPDQDFPMPDYGPEGHFVYDTIQNRLVAVRTLETYQKLMAPPKRAKEFAIYRIEVSRGCPFNCTYCCNNRLKKIYPGRYLRFKSLSRIKEELRWAKASFPNLSYIAIDSDTFNVYPELKGLCKFLKEEIKLSFRCLLSPLNTSEEMLDMLVSSGLHTVQIGLQTKCRKIEELYGRVKLNQNLDKIFSLLKKHNNRLTPLIDIIINSPWEKPIQTLQTIEYLNKNMPKRFHINIFTLTLFPKTDLWEKAKNEGHLDKESYLKPILDWSSLDQIQYTTLLLILLNKGFPRKLLWLLANRPLVYFFSLKIFTRGIFPKVIHFMLKINKHEIL